MTNSSLVRQTISFDGDDLSPNWRYLSRSDFDTYYLVQNIVNNDPHVLLCEQGLDGGVLTEKPVAFALVNEGQILWHAFSSEPDGLTEVGTLGTALLLLWPDISKELTKERLVSIDAGRGLRTRLATLGFCLDEQSEHSWSSTSQILPGSDSDRLQAGFQRSQSIIPAAASPQWTLTPSLPQN